MKKVEYLHHNQNPPAVVKRDARKALNFRQTRRIRNSEIARKFTRIGNRIDERLVSLANEDWLQFKQSPSRWRGKFCCTTSGARIKFCHLSRITFTYSSDSYRANRNLKRQPQPRVNNLSPLFRWGRWDATPSCFNLDVTVGFLLGSIQTSVMCGFPWENQPQFP